MERGEIDREQIDAAVEKVVAPAVLAAPLARRRQGPSGTSLRVGNVTDPAEGTADRFAEDLVAALSRGEAMADGTDSSGAPSRVSRAVSGTPDVEARRRIRLDREEPTNRIARSATSNPATVGPEGGEAPPGVSRAIRSAAGNGAPIQAELRSRIERASGTDLSNVRVHPNSEEAPRIDARAFTYGNDIHFASGEYNPASADGVRLIAHEVGHVVQQQGVLTGLDRTLRRAPLNSAAVLAAVDGLDATIKQHLDSPMPGEDKTSTAARTMRSHVSLAVDNYLKTPVAKDVHNNAVSLSIVLDGIAGVVSDALYDPWIRPKLATRLLDLYKTELTTGLAGGTSDAEKDDARHTTALAGVLLSNDPIGLFMHGELPSDETVRRIVLMSKDASGALNDYDPTAKTSLKASEMFTMLRRRFESQMLAYTQSGVMGREDLGRENRTKKISATRLGDQSIDASKPTAYSTRESTDQMSVRYFNSLFGTTTDPSDVADFTTQATKRLDDLGILVAASTADWATVDDPTTQHQPRGALVPRDPSVTPNQERVLQDIEADETHANERPEALKQLRKYARKSLGFDKAKAIAAVSAIDAKLAVFPLTITAPGSAIFETRVPKGDSTEFRPATQQHRVSSGADLFGKGEDMIEHVGAFDNPLFEDERGDRYLQFRVWKDRLMTQNRGLSPEEMPKFGALNVNWDTNYSASSQGTPATTTSRAGQLPMDKLRKKKFAKMTDIEKERRIQDTAVGENYYGDLHMVLKDHLIKQRRVVFTCTDHGAPHFDPLLAVYDAVRGEFITNLKSGEQTSVLYSVFNEAAQVPMNRLTSMLMIEAQIYGKLDIATDVETMVVAPFVHPDVKKNAKKFCKKHGINFVVIDPSDPKIANAVTAAIKPTELAALNY